MSLAECCAVTSEPQSQLNLEYLTTVYLSHRAGKTCLPPDLALSKHEFDHLLRYINVQNTIFAPVSPSEQSLIWKELLALRQDEWQDLVQLIQSHRKGEHDSELWLAKIIAAGCMGNDHLWCGLGLQDRKMLGALLKENFPGLAQQNVNNMRWKKFFYRQLCEQGGHFICRSPSCETCPTYDECFGDEA